ncbi:hypothetical protein [Larsenimonas suaedae]|uniref:Uncharacterized protein n=1 Tax=Larsenimonas suaedae TaxID=1851019 RepID=A0ABU1GZ74_9GAMM|nr:hypothetical protein [Larsenimonas suaedae]MCM2973471.1 hypothetical protein [Larsenimonas suaedae]MDR5897353.1 hypothetical protein [Larsenimonas suaedae]
MGSLALISGTEAHTASPRAGFLALRDELRSRHQDLDLIEVWEGIQPGERATLLRSAAQHLVPAKPINERPVDMRTPEAIAKTLTHIPMGEMPQATRDQVRAAIHRMSAYASRLKDRLAGNRPHPSQALAASARAALDKGDLTGARHFLSLIEHAE